VRPELVELRDVLPTFLDAANLPGSRAFGVAVELGRHAERLALGVEQRLGC
jgi:hypothetical protein